MTHSQQKRKETELEDGRTSRRLAAGGRPIGPNEPGGSDEDGPQPPPDHPIVNRSSRGRKKA